MCYSFHLGQNGLSIEVFRVCNELQLCGQIYRLTMSQEYEGRGLRTREKSMIGLWMERQSGDLKPCHLKRRDSRTYRDHQAIFVQTPVTRQAVTWT